MQPNQRLVNVLEQINKRYNSIFFSKLVLLDTQQQIEVPYIRHYDIQCQAVQSISDTLATKIKTIKFRSFYILKNFRKEDIFKRKQKTQNASFIHNYSTKSFYQRRNVKDQMRQGLKFAHTTRNIHIKGFDQTSEILSDIDYSMSALMNKMKYLNGRFHGKFQEDPQSPQLTQKIIKRKIILNKLNEIQSNLQQLMGEQLSSSNINHITSSQITLRYNPGGQKSYRTSRHVNRTFHQGHGNRF